MHDRRDAVPNFNDYSGYADRAGDSATGRRRNSAPWLVPLADFDDGSSCYREIDCSGSMAISNRTENADVDDS